MLITSEDVNSKKNRSQIATFSSSEHNSPKIQQLVGRMLDEILIFMLSKLSRRIMIIHDFQHWMQRPKSVFYLEGHGIFL